MLSKIDEMLKELGWADGFSLPLANEENKIFEREVEENLRKKAEKKILLEELADRLESLKNRDKQLLVEQNQTEELFNEYQSQCEVENNILFTLQREFNIIQREIQNHEKKLSQLRESRHYLENEKLILKSKLRELKASVEWGDEALAAWKEDLSKSDADANLLEKYNLEDDSKFCEIEVKRQKLVTEVNFQQSALDRLVSELRISESELSHSTKIFRQVHEERNKILDQWGAAVNFFQARDDAIMKVLMEIGALKNLGREKYKQLLQERQFYEEQFNDNSELYALVDEKAKNCEYLLEEQQRIKDTLNGIVNQVITSQRALTESEHILTQEKERERKLIEEFALKEAALKSLNEIVEDLKDKLNTLRTEAAASLDQSRIPQKMFEEKLKLLDQLFFEQKQFHSTMYRVQSELALLKEEGDCSFQEIQFTEAHIAAIDKTMKCVSKEIFNQEEILYNTNFQLTHINTDLAFEEGKRNNEYLDSLKQKISELEIDLKERTQDHDFILTQVTQSEEEYKRIKTEFVKDEPEISKLKDSINDLLIIVENGLRRIRSAENEANDRQVEENLLKLKANHLETLVSKEGTCLYSLEKQRLDLDTAMKERLVEIKTMKNLLLMQKRTLQEDRSDLKKSIEHLTIRIEQLKKRFEIARDMLGEYKENDLLTVTHLKIKLAQEKYELQEEGDDLDAKIHKAEEEITAMENSLKVINAANNLYKKNMSCVDEDDPELKERHELETQYFAALQSKKAKEKKLKTLKEQIEQIEASHLELESSEEELKKIFQEKDCDAQELDRHLENQERKLQRADRILKKLVREVHFIVERAPSIDFSERDIKLREIQELNQSSLQQLAELVTRYMETGPTVNRYLAEKNLSLPSIHSVGHSLSSRSKAPSSISSHVPSHSQSSLSVDGSAMYLDRMPSVTTIPSILVMSADSMDDLNQDCALGPMSESSKKSTSQKKQPSVSFASKKKSCQSKKD